MAPFAPTDQTRISRKFSSCSLSNIKQHLSKIKQGLVRNCFLEDTGSSRQPYTPYQPDMTDTTDSTDSSVSIFTRFKDFFRGRHFGSK